jgi:acyl-CoA thioesterase-1
MKMLKFLIVFFPFLLLAIQASAQTGSSAPHQLLVVIYGDTLTSTNYLPHDQTFPYQLEKRLRITGFEVKVVAMGDPEITTSTALEGINNLVGRAPDLVIVQLGETDMKRAFSHVGFYDNLLRIIKTLKQNGIYTIVMGTKSPAANGAEYSERINGYFKRIAISTPVYPYTLAGIAGVPDMTMGDNYRPNANGVTVMVNGIYGMVDTGLRWKLDMINKMRLQKQKR